MTHEQAELMQKLAMSVDCCLDLVAAEARKEKRANEGKALRQVTWQDREKSFGRLIVDARDALSADGHPVYF